MSRQLFQWVSKLVKTNPGETTIRAKSDIGCLVIERYQAGRILNNKLIFTDKHKAALRRKIMQEFDHDPFTTEQLPDSRLEVAKHHHNEKLAKHPVSHDHVLLNSPNGTLKLNHQAIQLQTAFVPNVGMLCLSSGITQIGHDAIVVVENLALMQLCGIFQLPPLCQDALWIYRGDHKTGARINACHDLLNRFGADKDVIVFSDMDPKGLEIALTIPHAGYWLGPDPGTWDDCFKAQQASRGGYDKQGVAMNYLLNKRDAGLLPEPFSELVSRMQKELSSYRQEQSQAHGVQLSLFSIK